MLLTRIADMGEGYCPTYDLLLTDGRRTQFTLVHYDQTLGLHYAHALQRLHDLLQAACQDKQHCSDPSIIGALEFWRDSKCGVQRKMSGCVLSSAEFGFEATILLLFSTVSILQACLRVILSTMKMLWPCARQLCGWRICWRAPSVGCHR